MRRLLLTVVMISLASCAGWPRSAGPEVADLEFLAGCWTYSGIDYGIELCWARTASGWRGSWKKRPAARNKSELALDVTRRDGTLELTPRPNDLEFSRIERVQLSYLTENAVAFGSGEQYVSFTRDPSGETLEVRFAPTEFPCVYPCRELREVRYRMRRVR